MNRILLITPFHKKARGNTHTSQRLFHGLGQRGLPIDLFSLESNNWQQELQKLLNLNYYSLIHGLNITYFTKVLQLFPQLTKLPLVVTMTGTDVNYDMLNNFSTEILQTLNSVQYIVILEDYYRTTFQTLSPQLTNKLVTIPQGVFLEKNDGPTRSQLGLNQDHFVFLLPSGLRPVKNITLAIHALKILAPVFSQLRLLIMGTIIDQEYYKTIMEQINMLSWALYLGEFPHNQMYSLLQLGDVVINTSWSEGQPQAALEAMSLGKPCLLTAVPGNLNIITNGQEGFYVNNKKDLAIAAYKLITDYDLRQKMGANARCLVKKKFLLQSELDAYELLYKKVLEDAN
ncbi:MAG: glycosyltransferase [Syntrophomonadaceae bacterium]|jgi:glycosyltransferase involved in cell wall biosynthesis